MPKNNGLQTSIVSKWHENCSLFRFLPPFSVQNHRFCPMEFYEPRKYKIFTFWWGWVEMFCPTFSFQAANQPSSDVQSVFFKFQLPHLWDFTPAFMMIYSRIYDEVVLYRLNPHGYCLEFVSAVDCNTSLPRIQNFQARKIIVSSRENFMLDTRINYIPYENEVYSSKEWSVFS